MTAPLYNMQAGKEWLAAKLGIKVAHVPTANEVEEDKKKVGSSLPAPSSIPSADDVRRKRQLVYQNHGQFAVSASIFFKDAGNRGITPTDGSIGAVTFDLIMEEEHTLEAAVCSHPVQYGDPVTDHIQPQLPSGRLSVLVTNYSIKDTKSATLPAGSKRAAWSESTNRALDAYRVFEQICAKRQVCTLVTVLRVYENVAITHVSAPKRAENGDAIIFEIAFQQIKTVKAKTVKLSGTAYPKNMDTDDNRQAAELVSAGVATPDVTEAPVEEDIVK